MLNESGTTPLILRHDSYFNIIILIKRFFFYFHIQITQLKIDNKLDHKIDNLSV
jgi:hypothetical protein